AVAARPTIQVRILDRRYRVFRRTLRAQVARARARVRPRPLYRRQPLPHTRMFRPGRSPLQARVVHVSRTGVVTPVNLRRPLSLVQVEKLQSSLRYPIHCCYRPTVPWTGLPPRGTTSPSPPQPLPPEDITSTTLSLDQSGTAFTTALDADTPDATPGAVPLPIPAPGATSVALPFFVSAPSVTVRLPGYFVLWDPNSGMAIGPDPVRIQAQVLALDDNNNPIGDQTDPSGYHWNNLGSPVTAPPIVPPSPQQQDTPPTVPIWSVNMATASNSGYRFVFENTSGWDGTREGATLPTVDLSLVLPTPANIVRFSVTDIETNLPMYSGTLLLGVSPTGVIQLKALPLLIIYQPPGDTSSVAYSQGQQITTGYSNTSSDLQGTTVTNTAGTTVTQNQNSTLNFQFPPIGSFGLSMAQSQQQALDTTTVLSQSNTQTHSNTFTLQTSFQTSWSGGTDGGDPAKGYAWAPPYMNDVFVLALHPQMALWDFLQPSAQAPGGVQVQFMGAESLQDAFPVPVIKLANCAVSPGDVISLGVTGPDGKTDELTGPDCTALLAMDPFFTNGQNYVPPSSLATDEGPIHMDSRTQLTLNATAQLSTSGIQTGISSFQGNIEAVESENTLQEQSGSANATVGGGSGSGKVAAAAGGVPGLSIGSSAPSLTLGQGSGTGTGTNSSNGLTTTWGVSNTTAATTGTTLTASKTLTIGDDGTAGQIPIYGQSYIDNRFGTWMFASDQPYTCTADNGAGCNSSCNNTVCPATCQNVSSTGTLVCPAVASTTGTWVQGSGVATAKCGDTVIIWGYGFTDANQVQFVPTDGPNVGILLPPLTIDPLSDDEINVNKINATGDPNDYTQPVVYNVFISGRGFSNYNVGQLVVTGSCN
ncbi:MAG: hypothetical protein ACYDHY_18265, partial [Acidiferrobacterales bacterium]